jgi:hypothetical protein
MVMHCSYLCQSFNCQHAYIGLQLSHDQVLYNFVLHLTCDVLCTDVEQTKVVAPCEVVRYAHVLLKTSRIDRQD